MRSNPRRPRRRTRKPPFRRRCPATVLFGDTFGATRLLPNCAPMKNPTTSYATVQKASPSSRPTPSGAPSSNPAKPAETADVREREHGRGNADERPPRRDLPEEPQHREDDDQPEVHGVRAGSVVQRCQRQREARSQREQRGGAHALVLQGLAHLEGGERRARRPRATSWRPSRPRSTRARRPRRSPQS